MIKDEFKNIKESKRGLSEILCKFLQEIEPDDVIDGLEIKDGYTLKAYFLKNKKQYYISVTLNDEE